MNWRDAISIIVQVLIFIFSSVFLAIGAMKGSHDIGKLIFYAWLALTAQQNIFHRKSWMKKEGRQNESINQSRLWRRMVYME